MATKLTQNLCELQTETSPFYKQYCVLHWKPMLSKANPEIVLHPPPDNSIPHK